MSHHAPAEARSAAAPPHHDEKKQPWKILALMLSAQLMVILDISVVNVALPSIGKDLSFTSADFQWAVSAYVLLSGGFLLLGGRLADLFDRRRVFLTGLGLFTIASLVSGLATSALMLTISRAAQGAGAAMLTPAALAILMTTYSGRQRNTALALWGTVGSMGIAAGVLFGGILTSALDWRAIFFVNIPIGIVVSLLARRAVEPGQATGRISELDIPGAVTAVSGLLLTVYGIEEMRTGGWTAPRSLWAFVAASVLFTAFVAIESRATTPLVPPATWKVRSLISASFVMAVVTGAVVGAIFISSLYLQSVLGSSAIVSGLQFLPLALAITVGAAISSHLLGHVGPKKLMISGLLVMATGAWLLASVGTDPTYSSDVLPGFLVMGLGVGPMFVAISVAAMAGIPHEKSGLASGLMMTGHEIGAALGVATVSAIAGQLTTKAGLVDAYPRVFSDLVVALIALAVVSLVAVPNNLRVDGSHGAGHGMH